MRCARTLPRGRSHPVESWKPSVMTSRLSREARSLTLPTRWKLRSRNQFERGSDVSRSQYGCFDVSC